MRLNRDPVMVQQGNASIGRGRPTNGTVGHGGFEIDDPKPVEPEPNHGRLRDNRDLVEARISAMPGLRTWHVEATYLAWIDARGLPVKNPVNFFEDAGIGLYDGALFDAPGFLRLNFACPRSLLVRALDRIQAAIDSLA